MSEKIEKPWGYELIIEHNRNYVVKKLFMMEGYCCSLQYHNMKTETIYVLDGTLRLLIGDSIDKMEEKIMQIGEFLTIYPKKIHRMYGISDVYYLESSTDHLDDIVRLKDEYGR